MGKSTQIAIHALQDFLRMNDAQAVERSYVWALENGAICHDIENGFTLVYEGDGIIRVHDSYEEYEDRAYDEHAYYAQCFPGKLFPGRCIELYMRDIALGVVKERED